jgi:subtilisin family serine protease
MPRIIAVLALALALGALAPLPPAAATADADVAPGRVIVKLRQDRAPRSAQGPTAALSVDEVAPLGAQVWRVESGREQEVARALAADPAVEYAEPDRIVRLYGAPNDQLYDLYQWNLPKIGAPAAWDVTVGDPSVVVAVVDSGFDLGHSDRPANLRLGCDYVRWRLTSFDGACPTVQDDANGHGTHVVGIVAARQNNLLGVSGVAPGVTVLAIRTADETGTSYVSDVASAVREATDAGARVINLSLGGPAATISLQSAIEYAQQRGVVVVAAMGNEYQSGSPTSYPAAYAGVIAVGAATHDDQHADYSSVGEHIALVAPGGNGDAVGDPLNWITSLFPEQRGGYAFAVGTSQAAPHVAATAGLMLSVRGALTGTQVASLLRATARPLGGSTPNPTFGYGYLDADAAVRAAQTGAAAAPSPPAPVAVETPVPLPLPDLPIGWQRQHLPLAAA